MILYHFTARDRFEEILAAGCIKPTDPTLRENLSERARRLAVRFSGDPLLADVVASWPADEIKKEFGGPLVVHLTSDHRDCSSVQTAKLAVRFAVDVQDARPWIKWARTQGIDESWLRDLRRGHRDARDWHIVPRTIPTSEWVDVIETESYDTLWERVLRT